MLLSKTRKTLYIFSWIPVILLHIPLLLLGFIAVPIALMFKKWPKVLWLWGNDEEDVPQWWYKKAYIDDGLAAYIPEFWWYAIRNPVNNFRFIFKDRKANTTGNWAYPSMEAQALIEHDLRVVYQWKWNGMFAGYRRVWLTKPGKYSEFWIGWKLDSTVPGMGFTTQLRLNRKVGT